MPLLNVTLPSGPLTVSENGTPNQAFGVIGFTAGVLGALNLATLTLVGADAARFGLLAPTAGPNGTFTVQIFARQGFDFENPGQRDFDVSLQAALLGGILGDAVTVTSDPISVTVTDVNDNRPTGLNFVPVVGGVLEGATGAVLGDLSLLDLDTVNGLVVQITGADAGLVRLDGNTLRLVNTAALTVADQTLDVQLRLVSDGVNTPLTGVTLDLSQLNLGVVPNPGGIVPIVGGPGNDTLGGSTGNDQQVGLGGNDTLRGSAGADTLNGGDGNDWVDYVGSPAAVNVNLTTGIGTGGWAQGDVLTGIENIRGSLFDDTLTGSDGNNTLVGEAGNDILSGRAGNDVLNGGAGRDTIVFSGNFENYAILDLGVRVQVTGLDGTDTVIGGEVLRFANGDAPFDDGDPLFDSLFYYGNYVDVFRAQISAKGHYQARGTIEQRDPNGFLSSTSYLSANADVRAAGVSVLDHFRDSGWREGRDPSFNFDTANYLARYTDVRDAGINPLSHYLTAGASEGRVAIDAVGGVGKVSADGFDSEAYLLLNPDVGFAGISARTHYEISGRAERRDPNSYFDTDGYLARHTDVAAAGVDAFQHYMTTGWREGRDPSAAFDTRSYLATYADVAAAQINPLLHFLLAGAAEGRQPVTDNILG